MRGRKISKRKWMQRSFKAVANTGVPPLHRALGLFGVYGASLLSPSL